MLPNPTQMAVKSNEVNKQELFKTEPYNRQIITLQNLTGVSILKWIKTMITIRLQWFNVVPNDVKPRH